MNQFAITRSENALMYFSLSPAPAPAAPRRGRTVPDERLEAISIGHLVDRIFAGSRATIAPRGLRAARVTVWLSCDADGRACYRVVLESDAGEPLCARHDATLRGALTTLLSALPDEIRPGNP